MTYSSSMVNFSSSDNADGVKEAGDVGVEVLDIEKVSFEEMEHHLENCTGLIIGTPTINQNVLLPVYQLFAAINPLRDKGKLGGSFGSYGWSGEAAKMVETNLNNLKIKFFGEGVFVKFSPHGDSPERCRSYGKAFATQMLADMAKE